jgi:hypothetical protein
MPMPTDNETRLYSALMLRNAIVRVPAVLPSIGSYRRVFGGHKPCTTAELLKNEEVPASLCRSLQSAVGEYLEQVTAPEVPAFASGRSLPFEGPAREITLHLDGAAEHAALDGVSGALFRRIYDAAAPGTFGDLQAMETRVDPLVRSGRELPADRFAVSPDLCAWVERTWAEHFQPARVRVEPYKINIYGPGDRFAAHRDTPEAGLVGTFLVALGGWGNPCDGGGLVVHDVGGCHRWDGAAGWAAFHPFLLHEVEPVADGARMTVAFKVFAEGGIGGHEEPAFDERLMNEAADRIALCQNEFGQVGVLLSFAYSLNCTALCGRDLLLYRILERFGTVASIPVAVHVDASNRAQGSFFWAADAHVYGLSPENLARLLDGDDDAKAATGSDDPPAPIPFIPMDRGFCIYNASRAGSEWTGNYAEPANVDTLYVHRALVVTARARHDRPVGQWLRADLRKTDLSGMNLDGANLAEADLQGSLLAGASLRGAVLDMANLSDANLAGADLSCANLSNATLCNASLAGANLREAVLEWADLSNAVLAGADFTQANIEGVYFYEVSLEGVTLRQARWFLETYWPGGCNPVALCGTLPTDEELSASQLTWLIGHLRASGVSIGLELDRLKLLADDEADVVAGYEGSVSLNGLSTLSDHAAMALSRHTGEWLSLDGVTTLSTAAADALAGYNGVLGLNSLATLTSGALATRLVSKITTDQVESQKRLLDSWQEEIPPWSHFGEVALPAVTELSPEAAHAIVEGIRAVANEYPDLMIDAERGNGSLELNGLRSLSAEVARELARHGGYLGLRGVTVLSAAAAEALAGIGEHTLDLSGLHEMADDVAEALAKHKGRLVLKGLERWSDAARQRFTPCTDFPAVYTSKTRWP